MNYEQLCAAVLVEGTEGGASSGLAIVANRRLSVAALTALLLNDPHRSMVRAARGQEEVCEALQSFRPSVVIAEGLTSEWANLIDPTHWNGRSLLLLDPEDEAEAFVDAVRSRAQGYLSRTAAREALEGAIESVRRSGYYLDPVLAGRILWASEESRTRPPLPAKPELSSREREILARIATGRSSKEIAREYGLSPKTVCNHVSNIYAKLNFTHRGQLVLYATQQGLTSV